jgi:hypothetical protein
MEALDAPLHRPPTSLATKHEILKSLWSNEESLEKFSNYSELTSFFEYYTKECRRALHGARHISVRSHADVVQIAESIKNGLSKEEIKSMLKDRTKDADEQNSTEVANSSIDLTARLMSMMGIGLLPYGFSGRPQLEWSNGSLKDFLSEYFDSPVILGNEHIKLEKVFNARNMVRMAGFEIEWTDNLADHLRLIDDEDKKVAIFHHASFLKYQKRYAYSVISL